MSQIEVPREIKVCCCCSNGRCHSGNQETLTSTKQFCLPTGDDLIATRNPGQDNNATTLLYTIQCVGRDKIMKTFVDTTPLDLKHTLLLKTFKLATANPTIRLFRVSTNPDGSLRQIDNIYNLNDNETTAIIIQARALGGRYGFATEGDAGLCKHCREAVQLFNSPVPFTKLGNVLLYNF